MLTIIILVLSSGLINGLKHPKDAASVKQTPIQGQVINGIKATARQFPWQVMLIRSGEFWCGGSLIHAQWVLTAAHCIDLAQNYSVRFATLTKDDFEEGRLQLDISSDDLILHEDYVDGKFTNDIALMKLPVEITLPKSLLTKASINKIRLPKANDRDKTFVGQTAIASGWGRDDFDDDSSYSRELMYVSQTVVTNTECNDFYKNIASSQICVDTEEDSGTCSGDSGGPLVIKGNDKKYTLVGVNNFGTTECVTGPDVFTRVTSFIPWIIEQTGVNF